MEEATRVVHCKKEPFDVYIGRGGPWGNPFVIGKDGDREHVIKNFEGWFRARPGAMAKVGTLKGKVLGCWCAPKFCHGDVLARLAEEAGE